MALTPNEAKRLAELEKRVSEQKYIQKTTQQELNDLYAKQNQKLSDTLKLSKSIAKAESDHEKTLKSSEKSISSILGNLVQGNLAQAATEAMGRKSLSTTVARSKENTKIQKSLKTQEDFSKLDGANKNKILDLVNGINSGLYTEVDLQATLEDIGEERLSSTSDLAGILQNFAELGDEEKKSKGKVSELQEEFNKRLGKATVAFGILLTIGQKFAATINDMGKSFGVIANRSGELKDNLLSSSVEATKLGGGISDVSSITSDLTSNFGMSLDSASELSAKVFDTSIALGLSAGEGANLFGVLTETANLSAVQAEKLAESTFQLAAQVGVNPSQVMKDIAGSSETIASFTRDGGDNIARAAIQARALGVSLDTTAKITSGLLDFENSITNEVEASVLIGRQLNFQKARELALNNDIEGAMKNVVSQLGSEAEFNKLNSIQRDALAKSIGVSTAELAKFVGKEKEALSLSTALSTGASFSDLVGADAISQITAAFNGFKAISAEIVNVLGPGLEFIGGVFSNIAGFIQQSSIAMGALSLAAKGLAVYLGYLAIAGAMSALSAIPVVGVPLALAAGAAIAGGIVKQVGKMKSVNDFSSGPGGITHMAGPAGTFSLNPRDSVLATTNPIPVNDFSSSPAGTKSIGPQSVDVNVIGEFKAGTVKFANERGLGSVNQVSTRPV